MNLYGVNIEVDDTQAEQVIKFVHPSGRQDVFNINGNKVIDVEPATPTTKEETE